MKKHVFRIAVIALTLLAAGVSRAAAQEDLAILSYIKGDVRVKPTDGKNFAAAEQDMSLRLGDAVRTGANSRARIVTEDGDAIVLGPNSALTIGRGDIDYSDDSSNTDFELDSGKARAIVDKLATSKSSFQIKTPTAVAGVRGTDFVVEVDPETEESAVTVLDGEVDVDDRLGRMKERVRLGRDQELRFGRRSAPGAPRKLNAERIREIKENMAHAIGEQAPGADPDNVDRAASALLALKRAPIPDKMKKQLIERIKSGEMSPVMARRVLRLSHRGVPPEAILKIIDYVKENADNPDVQEFVKEMKNAKSPEEAKKAFEKAKQKADRSPNRPRLRDRPRDGEGRKQKQPKGK